MRAQAAKNAPSETPSSERTRYRVMTPVYREGRDKPFWVRLGTAFENPPKNGNPPTISVKLDAAPLAGELVLFVDDDRPAAEGGPSGGREDRDGE